MYSLAEIEVPPAARPSPLRALTGAGTPEPGVRRSRQGSIHCLRDGFLSSPAFRRIWPVSVCRITASGLLMQNAG